jgi:hypothetical protein
VSCPVRIRLWSHKPGGTFDCRLNEGHGPAHEATGLYPHQTISWVDGDRRAFTGEFTPCDQSSCILPAGHGGSHAA